MQLLIIGITHHQAPVELREKVAFTRKYLPAYYRYLCRDAVLEAVLLSTCNRSEIIVGCRNAESAKVQVARFLDKYFAVPASLSRSFFTLTGAAAYRHLGQVASGLQSAVIGETYILGQMKRALQQAQTCGAAGNFLTSSINRSLRLGRAVREKTVISRGAVSVPQSAVVLAEQVAGSLRNKNIILIGTGKISINTGKYIVKRGGKITWIANRTFDRARQAARQLGAQAVRLDKLAEYLCQADMVFSATASPHYILRADRLEKALGTRNKPLIIFDLAVPRDADPALAGEMVKLYNIDSVKTIIAANLKRRANAVGEAERIIKTAINQLQVA